MATFLPGESFTVNIDADDTVSWSGEGSMSVTLSDGRKYTSRLTGNQTVGAFGKPAAIVFTADTAGSYSTNVIAGDHVLATTNPVTGGIEIPGVAGFKRYVSPNAGNVATLINQAAADIVASGRSGYISLAPGGNYAIDNTLTIDTSFVGIDGQGAIIDVSALSAGAPGILLTASQGTGATNKYPLPMAIRDITIQGAEADGRDATQYGIRAHSDVAGSSVRATLNNVRARWLNRGISIGSRAYFLRGYGVEIGSTKHCVYQESGATDFVENIAFFGGSFFSSDCFIKMLSSQRLRLYGMSLDYFGERITADDQMIDLEAGSSVELYGCHLEWDYGKTAGQTRAPIRITGANSSFTMIGGKLIYTGTRNASTPYWKNFVSSDNLTQTALLENVVFANMGRVSDQLSDDALVGSATADNTGDGASVKIINPISVGNAPNDMPSVGSYHLRSNETISGVSAPHTELVHRIAVTGTAAIASAASPQGAINARNSVGAMMSIAGAGKVMISFPVNEAMRRRAWALFLNAGSATGTITVKERMSTTVPVWNGTTVVQQADARASYSPTTVSITGGTNEWRRVSWKDCNTAAQPSARMNCEVFTVEIDTSAMTGTLYLDDIAVQMW